MSSNENSSDAQSIVQSSIQFLSSDAGLSSLNTDVYWPKWDSPWWHMAVLYEMGLADQIPTFAAKFMASRLKAQLIPYFFGAEVPEGRDSRFDAPCPCQLGNIYQIVSATGINVDEVLPWARKWFLKYQMPDGGLSCDEEAYKANQPASSLVATIAPLEAVLFFTRRPFTDEEEQFLDRGASCLIERKLMLGCSAEFNAEERLDEEDWLKLCFPRFYFYDVLRGLNFILHWADKRSQALPSGAIVAVVEALNQKFPDGQVRIERKSFEGVATRIKSESGEWVRREQATLFPLLDQVSQIGKVSPSLTKQWRECRELIRKLAKRKLIQ